MNKTFYHQTVTSKQIENYISKQTGYDLNEFFNQYLRTTKIPTLEYKIDGKSLEYRWTNVIEKFDMPVQIAINDNLQWLFPKTEWKTLTSDDQIGSFQIDLNFYVKSKKI